MNDAVREWIAKADDDYDAAQVLAKAVRAHHDAVCFHAQQCVEKLFKAALVQRGVVPPPTHDLLRLDQLLRSVQTDWACEKKDLRFLVRGGVAFRYPGESATAGHASAALSICTRSRESLLKLIDEEVA